MHVTMVSQLHNVNSNQASIKITNENILIMCFMTLKLGGGEQMRTMKGKRGEFKSSPVFNHQPSVKISDIIYDIAFVFMYLQCLAFNLTTSL